MGRLGKAKQLKARSVYVFCLACFLIPLAVYSQDKGIAASNAMMTGQSIGWSEYASGPLLRVSCRIRAEVWLDDLYKGLTPLLLELSPGEHRVEVVSRNMVDRRIVTASPSILTVTQLDADPKPYRSLLAISCDVEGAEVFIDGAMVGTTPLKAFELSEGTHEVRIAAETSTPFEGKVETKRDTLSTIEAKLAKGFPFRIEGELPPETKVLVIDEKGLATKSIDFKHPDLLPGGKTRFRAVFPRGYSVDFFWDPSSPSPAKVDIKGKLLLGVLPEGTTVELNGERLWISTAGEEFSLAPGVYTLVVRRAGFIPITTWFDLSPGGEIQPLLLFVRDPILEAQKKALKSRVAFLYGATLSLGGLLLNSDSFAVPISANYESYKLIKYASLGVAGGGIALILAGISALF